jgi:uncharacterized protein YbdZ (MbtH family)
MKKILASVVIIHEISNTEEFFSIWQEGEAIPQMSLECRDRACRSEAGGRRA